MNISAKGPLFASPLQSNAHSVISLELMVRQSLPKLYNAFKGSLPCRSKIRPEE
jgi:hypothetical protein